MYLMRRAVIWETCTELTWFDSWTSETCDLWKGTAARSLQSSSSWQGRRFTKSDWDWERGRRLGLHLVGGSLSAWVLRPAHRQLTLGFATVPCDGEWKTGKFSFTTVSSVFSSLPCFYSFFSLFLCLLCLSSLPFNLCKMRGNHQNDGSSSCPFVLSGVSIRQAGRVTEGWEDATRKRWSQVPVPVWAMHLPSVLSPLRSAGVWLITWSTF